MGTTSSNYFFYIIHVLLFAAPSTFECVDHAPEAVNSGSASENGARIYNVEGYCESSSLPCPGYTAGLGTDLCSVLQIKQQAIHQDMSYSALRYNR